MSIDESHGLQVSFCSFEGLTFFETSFNNQIISEQIAIWEMNKAWY